MLIIYVDSDTSMQEQFSETFRLTHTVYTFDEMLEAYKWIRHNEIPDMIVTEMDVDASMGLQSLRFLQSKAKLKKTHLIGYTHQPGNYEDLVTSEGAAALFAKETLLNDLSVYFSFIGEDKPKSKAKTLRDIEVVRGVKTERKAQRTEEKR